MNARGVTFACSVWVAAVAVASVAHTAEAEAPRSRVTLVRASSSDRLLRAASTRLHAELTGAGFDVVDVDRAPDAPADPRHDLEAAADGGDSFATITLNRASFGAFADVWVSDHLTGKTVVRRLEVGDASNAASVLAIRALELLRASLLELAEPTRPASPTISAPADVRAFVQPALPARTPRSFELTRETALDVSVFGLAGSGGLAVGVGPSLRVSRGFGGPWFGRVCWVGPLLGAQSVGTEGQASVRQELAALELGAATSAQPFGLLAWIGLGGYHLHTVGSSAAPYHARSDDVLSFAARAGVGAAARIATRVLLTAELGTLWLVPYPVVVIANKDVGTAGRPSLSLALGMMVGL